MNDKPTSSAMSFKIRRFVAYSLLAHFGAASVWGVPAYIRRASSQDRTQEEAALAEHFRKEEVKTKEHAHKQRIDKIRRDVQAAMRKEFEKLVATLAEKRQDELWKAVEERTKKEATDIAEAISNPNSTAQDLRTLETELNRAMVSALDEELNSGDPRVLADRFVDRVERDVVPDLAKWMQDELQKRVIEKMREEAEQAITQQGEDDKRLREQTLAPLRDAAAKAAEANAAATAAGEQLAKLAGKPDSGAKPETGDATPVTKSPVETGTTAGAKPESGAAIDPGTTAGAKPEAGSAPENGTTAGIKPETGATADPGAAAGAKPAITGPASDPGASAGAKPETTGPASDPGASAGAKPETTGPASDPGASAGAKPDPSSTAGTASAAKPATGSAPEAGPATVSKPDAGTTSATGTAAAAGAKPEAGATSEAGTTAGAKPASGAQVPAGNPGAVGKQVEEAGARLAEADATIGKAAEQASGLDAKAKSQVAAVDTAIAAARVAVDKALTAVNENSPDAQAAVGAAKAATAAVQAAAKQAIDTVSAASDREAVASAAVRAASESELSKQVGKTLKNELTNTTLPRLSGKLQDAFREQLSDAGLSDDALVAKVGQEIQDRLAKSVLAQVQAGSQVTRKLGDVGSVPEGSAPAKPGDSALDKSLSDSLTGIGANADKRIGEMAANASQDARLVGKAKSQGAGKAKGAGKDSDGEETAAKRTGKGKGSGGEGEGEGDDAALADVRARVSAMMRGMRNGGGGGSGTGGMGLGSAMAAWARDERAYADLLAKLAGREVEQGERWGRKGAEGETSQAEATTGQVAAYAVGPVLSEAKPDLTNDQRYKPTFNSIVFTTVPYFSSNFRIDGNLDKWEDVPGLPMKPDNTNDRSKQVMKIAWSNAGLFVLFRVTDPDRQIAKSDTYRFWLSDNVELWIDSFNTKERLRSNHAGQQFWIWPQGATDDPNQTGGESIKKSIQESGHNEALHSPMLERWATVTPEGWTMEARLSSELLPDADLTPGRIIGFNAYVSTNGKGYGEGAVSWFWSAGKDVKTYNQPDTWGDLLLAGSDAKLEVIPTHGGDRTKVVAMIGEPLQLRITDPDMDLKATARDKVIVTLKDSRGHQQIAVLEESGDSTGIFDGSVTTALALDEQVPAVLSVYEGEQIGISYVDQARANGARNAEVSTTVTFGAAVMAMADSGSAKIP